MTGFEAHRMKAFVDPSAHRSSQSVRPAWRYTDADGRATQSPVDLRNKVALLVVRIIPVLVRRRVKKDKVVPVLN
jgi:hypothetical protein